MPARSKRTLILVTALTASAGVLAIGFLTDQFTLLTRGFVLDRKSAESIRISWGTPSGASINPTNTLEWLFGNELAFLADEGLSLPEMSREPGVWMYPLDPGCFGNATPASFVNPLNRNAKEMMWDLIALARGGSRNTNQFTRLVDDHYIYLGWAVQNEGEFQLLCEALESRPAIDTASPIQSENTTLHRLHGTAPDRIKAAGDPRDRDQIAASIPVVLERIDRRQGHPGKYMRVLYLDGHVDVIQVGTRFPATPTVISYFESN